MAHAAELAAILLLVAAGQGVIDVSPHAVRRVATSFLSWAAAFAVGIAILSVPAISVTAVEVGIALLAAYMAQWIIMGVVDYWRGPFLMELPRRAELRAAAQRAAPLTDRQARRMCRRLLREYDGCAALLALCRLEARADWTEAAFEEAWRESCAAARAQATALAERFSATRGEGRLQGRALSFAAQALCLYEADSVQSALASIPNLSLAARSGRIAAGEALEKMGRRNAHAERLGLWASGGGPAEHPATALDFNAVLWPALGLARAGFPGRAAALGIAEGLLLAYGVTAFYLDRPSGFVFFAVGILIHVQAAMALRDFPIPGAQAAGAAKGRLR